MSEPFLELSAKTKNECIVAFKRIRRVCHLPGMKIRSDIYRRHPQLPKDTKDHQRKLKTGFGLGGRVWVKDRFMVRD